MEGSGAGPHRKPRAVLQAANLKFRPWWFAFSVKEMT
jgi:hypothetical protein